MLWALRVSAVVGLVVGVSCARFVSPQFWPACAVLVGLVVMNIGAMLDQMRAGSARTEIARQIASLRIRSVGLMVSLVSLFFTLLWPLVTINQRFLRENEPTTGLQSAADSIRQVMSEFAHLREALTSALVALLALILLLFWTADTISKVAAARDAEHQRDRSSPG